MKVLDVLNSPWAIQPAKLLEIQSIYATHLRGDKIDIAAVEKQLGRPLANEPKAYEIIDGVAVVRLEGVIAKRMNLFTQMSGGVSTEKAERDLRDADADPAVHSIIKYIDSPGGTVDGTQLLADLQLTKPVVTLASGTMASAAYWIGSAAQGVYIADATTQVGSIGVVATHVDVSKAEQQLGRKTTEVFAGAYKRIDSQYAPLSAEGRASIQERVDYLYSLFVGAVAKHRGVSESAVLKNMADGRIFIGQQAIDAGLVDGVATLPQLVDLLNRNRAAALSGEAASIPPGRAGVASPIQPGASMPITREQLAAEAPDLLAAIQAEAADAERARIQAVHGQRVPGHEQLVAEHMFNGSSGAGDVAVAILAAERAQRDAHAAALAADAPAPVPQTPSATVRHDEASATSAADLDAKARAHMAANPGTDYLAAYKAVGGK